MTTEVTLPCSGQFNIQ